MNQRREVLRLEQISTRHNGVKVLADARLNVFSGESVGIIGINNSGKSALAGAMCGFLPCTAGRIYFMENLVEIPSIMCARQLGICYIQQKSTLIMDMTVTDNLMLSSPNKKFVIWNESKIRVRFKETLASLGIEEVNLDAEVETLSEYQRLALEVCKAVFTGVKVIVFDSVLGESSINLKNNVGEMLKRIEGMGISVVVIETKYRYCQSWCERIFVMRSGRTVAVLDSDTDEEKIVSLMMGYPKKLNPEKPRLVDTKQQKKELMTLARETADGESNDFSCKLYEGEIAGILCLEKSSYKAIEYMIEGKSPRPRGLAIINGTRFRITGADALLKLNIVVIHDGDYRLFGTTFEENILLSAYKKTSRGIVLNQSELKYLAAELKTQYFSEYGTLSRSDMDSYIQSGEDWLFYKKIMLCRGLAVSPKLMIFISPTLHNDFLVKRQFYEDIVSIKKQHIGGLILSTDIEELLSICDRIYVVQNDGVMQQYFLDESGREALEYDFSSYLRAL